jgi:hypothetical protein
MVFPFAGHCLGETRKWPVLIEADNTANTLGFPSAALGSPWRITRRSGGIDGLAALNGQAKSKFDA